MTAEEAGGALSAPRQHGRHDIAAMTDHPADNSENSAAPGRENESGSAGGIDCGRIEKDIIRLSGASRIGVFRMVRETGAFSSEGEPALGKGMRRLFGDLVRRGGTAFAHNVRSARLPFVWEPALDDDTGRWISALQSEVAAAVLASRFYVFFRRNSAGVDRLLIAQAGRSSEIPSHDTLLACHGLAQVFFDDLTMRHRSAGENGTPLTPRERECLAWSAEGKTSEEIAMILSLSTHTVNHYLVGATKKLDAANRMHAITIAIRTGILNIDGNLNAA